MGLKLNLGCGKQYLAGYVNCDAVDRVKADRYFDLDRPPYPFESEVAEANITAVDQSRVAIDHLRQALPGAKAEVGDIARLDYPDGTFDVA